MKMPFDSEHLTGEGSLGNFRIEGEDHEYEDFLEDKFPTPPPDLPISILDDDDEVNMFTEKNSIKKKQACPSEKKAPRESPSRFLAHTASIVPTVEIIDLESIEPSNQRSSLDQKQLEAEIAMAGGQPILTDDDEPSYPIKKENDEESFPWRDMGSKLIELLDSDEETAVISHSDQSTMNSKITEPQKKFSALLSSAVRARNSPIDHAKMLEIQRRYVARVLEKSIPSVAGAIFKGSQPPPDQSATLVEEDQHAWMKANVDFDTDAAAVFVSPFSMNIYTDTYEVLPT